MIKLFQPYVNVQAKVNVQRVLSSTQLAEGPEVKLFEKEFAQKFGFEPWQIVTVNSGTSALELAYELVGVTEFTSVITPVLTCTATTIPLVRRRPHIIFADVEGKKHLNIDPEALENHLEQVQEWPRKLVNFVHFGGSSMGLIEVEELCEQNGAELICDAAQALGSPLSTKARFSTISLQAIKSLTAGDGGILICRDREDAKKARKLRWYGYDRELKQREGDCDLDLAGYKYHMNDIAAALARGNLAVWEMIRSHRDIINNIYQSQWERTGKKCNFVRGIWNPTVVGYDYQEAKYRSEKHGFQIGQHHYRNDKYSIFRSAYSNCPNMDKIGDDYFMLPCHMGVQTKDAEMIAEAIFT